MRKFNGNIFKITDNRDGNRTQNFTYDALNRIQTAYTNGPNWEESFGSTVAPGGVPATAGIDAWGNLTNRSPITGKSNYEALNAAPATTRNQLPGLTYDAAGNVINDGLHSYTYDAENRIVKVDGGAWNYVYDGDGNRVEKCTAGSTAGACASGATGTLYWKGRNGETINESDLGATTWKRFVYFDGKMIARRDSATGNVYYFYSDNLGSIGVVTDALGQTITNESDYYPYGGERVIANSLSDENYKFTGKERDSESGLDNFGARLQRKYYGQIHDARSAGRTFGEPAIAEQIRLCAE